VIYLFLGLLFVLGLVVGSFIGNYTYRAPKGKSFFLGRSICDSCQVNLSWFDNIPLLSYLILRGRCRNCQRKISSRYPLIELATGLLFVGIFLALKPQAVTLAFYLLVVSGVVGVFVIDLEEQIIPDGLVFFLLTVTFLFLLIFSSTLFTHLATGFLAATFLLCLHLATRGKGMGLGDVKFGYLAFFGFLDRCSLRNHTDFVRQDKFW